MYQQFQINIQYKTRERRIFNALLALATGVLSLIYPNFLYLIAGGYLMALGLTFLYFKTPAVISAFPIVTGIIIFLFPEVIPVTMAVFLGFFGLILLMSLGFVFMGVLTLIIAALIIANPDSIAYLIAAFLLLYAVSNLFKLFQDSGSGNGDSDSQKPKDRKEIVIE